MKKFGTMTLMPIWNLQMQSGTKLIWEEFGQEQVDEWYGSRSFI